MSRPGGGARGGEVYGARLAGAAVAMERHRRQGAEGLRKGDGSGPSAERRGAALSEHDVLAQRHDPEMLAGVRAPVVVRVVEDAYGFGRGVACDDDVVLAGH